MAYLKLYTGIRQEGLRTPEEPQSEQSLCRGDSNRVLSEYNSDVLPPQSTCLFDRHEHLLEGHT
jgi:hypothetical protein